MSQRLRQRAAAVRRQDAQASLELALCLPFVAVLLAALVEVGLLVADQTRLWHAAREAVRVAAVSPDGEEIRAAAETAGLTPLEVSVRPSSTGRVHGEPVTVSLSYRPPGHVPLVGQLIARFDMRAGATMRIEQP